MDGSQQTHELEERREEPFHALSGLLPPEMILLVAMLRDQIEELGLLWALGFWQEDPAEMAPMRGGSHAARCAVIERQLWGGATDSLIAALDRHTPIRIDRGRIVALARRRGERMCADGRLRRRNTEFTSRPGRRMAAAGEL